jgi:hypothetical protein
MDEETIVSGAAMTTVEFAAKIEADDDALFTMQGGNDLQPGGRMLVFRLPSSSATSQHPECRVLLPQMPA